MRQLAAWLVYGIVATIPLIFGAVHPIVLGFYVLVILAGLGGWLIFSPSNDQQGAQPPSLAEVFLSAAPFLLILYVILQSVPLPLEWLELLSPERAHRVQMVNILAGTELQRATLSDNGPFGLYRAFLLLALLLYYFSVKRLLTTQPGFDKTLVLCLISVGAFQALYGLIQFINPQVGILWLSIPSRAAYGTIIYKNQYASLLNMIWPLALAGAAVLSVRRRGKKRGKGIFRRLWASFDEFSTTSLHGPLLLFATGGMLLAVLFSLSRGGILTMLLVALLLLVILPFSRAWKFGFLALFIALIAGYGSLLGLDILLARFDSLDNSGAVRLQLYLASLPLLAEHWLTGIGLGSYTLLSPVYLKGFPAHILFDRVHNEYLELLIELGIPAASLFFIWILVGMGKLATGLISAKRKHANDPAARDRLILGTAAFCGLIGFFVHGVVDFGWRLPANLVYCTTLLAICVTSIEPKPTAAVISESGRAPDPENCEDDAPPMDRQ